MAFFCPNCGTENSDTDKFCQSCGAKLETGNAVEEPAAAATTEGFDEFVEPSAQQNDQYSADFVYQGGAAAITDDAPTKKKGNAAPVIIAVAAIAVIAVIAIVLTSLNKYTKIDAKDLFYIDFAGPDGYGVCYAEVDIDPIFAWSEYGVEIPARPVKMINTEALESVAGAKSEAKESKSEYSKYFSDNKKDLEKAYPKAKDKSDAKDKRDALLDVNKKEGKFRLTCTPSKTSGLSNGDTVTIEVEYDEEELKENGIKLENTTFDVEVKGLESSVTIDAFKGLTPTFTGLDGEGYLEYESLSGEYDFIYYNVEDSSYNLKNGDEITVQGMIDVWDYTYIDEEDQSKGFWFRYKDKLYVWPYESRTTTQKFSVSGLTELNELDPFNEIELVYEGAVPFLDVSVKIKDDSEYVDILYASIDDDYNDRYGVGDTFTVKVYAYSSLKEKGYKLKDVDSDGYATKEYTINAGDESIPAYVNVHNAAEANTSAVIDEMFKNAETEIKQKLQGTKYYYASDTNLTLDDKCDKVSKMTAIATYLVTNDITDYSALGYNPTINSIVRVYKVELKLKDGKQTVYITIALKNVIFANGEFYTESTKTTHDIYSKKADALEAVEGKSGYTVVAIGTSSSAEEPADESSVADESSTADESSEAESSETEASEAEAEESTADAEEASADTSKAEES